MRTRRPPLEFVSRKTGVRLNVIVTQHHRFAEAARSGETVWAAGAYDALSARLIEEAGFAAAMTTGFGISAAHLGQPDMELYTMSENLDVVGKIVDSVSIPVIADTDTGYGNAINVMRTVREFERAGVAAMIFEDQQSPKRCPAAANQVEVLPLDEGTAKIRAAVHARRSEDTLIIARTDAMTEAEAIERGQAYVDAGADLVQPISRCFSDFAGLARFREAVGVPLSLQLLGWLENDLAPAEVEQLAGLAVFPLVALMTASAALRTNLKALAERHSSAQLPNGVTTMGDFKSLIGFEELEAIQNRFLVGRGD